MPSLRRLSLKELLSILRGFGFEIVSQRGSHMKLERIHNGQHQRILIAGHGNKTIKLGTLLSIYRDLCRFVSEAEARKLFYTD